MIDDQMCALGCVVYEVLTGQPAFGGATSSETIACSDGYHRWSERYDRQMADVFDIQDELSPPSWIGYHQRDMPEIRTRERDGVMLIDVSGDMSNDAGLLHAEIANCLALGLSRVVLNLEQVTYIDSTWLGAIVMTLAKLRTAGGQLKLLNVPRDLMQTLAVTRLSTVFDIFTSEDDAVNSYFPVRPLLYPHLIRETEMVWPAADGRSPLTVFLCHSSGDKDAVRALHRGLRAAGARPWLDEVDLLPGQIWEREIPAAVRRSDAVLVCLSVGSTVKSGFVQKEIKFALDAAEEQSDDSIYIVPGRLETCEVPARLRRWQWVDLFAADGFDRLITALQARALALGRSPLQIA